MKYILTTFALAAITLSTSTRATADVYIDIAAGASILNDWEFTESISNAGSFDGDYDGTYKFDTGRAIYFEVGKKTDNRKLGLIAGITYNEISHDSYVDNPFGGGDITLDDFGVTDRLDLFGFPLLGAFSLETNISDKLTFNAGIGAGINFLVAATGYDNANIETTQDLVFQFQAKAGLDFALSDNVSLGLDYRFSGLTSPEIENDSYGISSTTEGDTITAHFIGLGLNIEW